MVDKPTIYGYCPSGCKWEVPHKEDLTGVEKSLSNIYAEQLYPMKELDFSNSWGSTTLASGPICLNYKFPFAYYEILLEITSANATGDEVYKQVNGKKFVVKGFIMSDKAAFNTNTGKYEGGESVLVETLSDKYHIELRLQYQPDENMGEYYFHYISACDFVFPNGNKYALGAKIVSFRKRSFEIGENDKINYAVSQTVKDYINTYLQENKEDLHIRYATDEYGANMNVTHLEGYNYMGIYMGIDGNVDASLYTWFPIAGGAGSGIGVGSNQIPLTQEEYDNLSYEEKYDPNVMYLTDGPLVADQAFKDGNGNVIADTYLTKDEVESVSKEELDAIKEGVTPVGKAKALDKGKYTIDNNKKELNNTGNGSYKNKIFTGSEAYQHNYLMSFAVHVTVRETGGNKGYIYNVTAPYYHDTSDLGKKYITVCNYLNVNYLAANSASSDVFMYYEVTSDEVDIVSVSISRFVAIELV